MPSSTPIRRTASLSTSGGGGPRPGSGCGDSVSLTLLSSAAPSTSRAAPCAIFGALPPCSKPEVFNGEGDFWDYLLQFTTTARLSGWQTATTENRPYYFALRLKGNALHFYTTLTVAKQQNFDPLVAAFYNTYTTNVDILQAKHKTARHQPSKRIDAFLCDVRTLARRVYTA